MPVRLTMSTPTQLGAVFGLAFLFIAGALATAILGVVTWFFPIAAIGSVSGLIFTLFVGYRLYQAGRS